MSPDPFDALRGPDHPVAPDPAFAVALQRRLVAILAEGPPPVSAAPTSHPTLPTNGVRQGDLSYAVLAVPDLAAAQAFYGELLGWRFDAGRHSGGLRVLGTAPLLMLWGPEASGGRVGVTAGYRVDDVAAAAARVRTAGGTSTDPRREDYGLLADCTDLQGRPFGLHQLDDHPVLAPGARARQGDLSYVTMGVEDGERDRAFYAQVLGWTYAHGNPVGLLPETGVWSPADRRVVARQEEWTQSLGPVLCYQVDDIAAAVRRGRDLGGTFGDPEQRPYGLESHGRDDQGIELYLHQLA